MIVFLGYCVLVLSCALAEKRSPNVIDKKPVYIAAFNRLTPEESAELGKTCGKRREKVSKIHHGNMASLGQFPWAVAFTRAPGTTSFCTGTLISERHVITAAHCFFNQEKLEVKNITTYVNIGGVCNYKSDECDEEVYDAASPVKTIKVVATMLISEFLRSDRNGGDLAIAELESPVEFGKRTYPACLPSPSFRFNIRATHWGYGFTEKSTKTRKVSASLQYIATDLVKCTKAFPTHEPPSADCVCASSPSERKQRVDFGDSGSGLEVIHKNRSYSIGSLSYSYEGKGDCSTDHRHYAKQICQTAGVCYMLDETK